MLPLDPPSGVRSYSMYMLSLNYVISCTHASRTFYHRHKSSLYNEEYTPPCEEHLANSLSHWSQISAVLGLNSECLA
jgi:hypothetical protein